MDSKGFVLPVSTLDKIIKYLAERPFKEVVQIIEEIKKEGRLEKIESEGDTNPITNLEGG